jgi:hypothetical protein
MIVREIVTTCSNPYVAGAALASIGGDFERGFAKDATSRSLSSGALASRLVRAFVCRADDNDWDSLVEVTRGAEMPVLTGLRYLLERAQQIEEDISTGDLQQRSVAPSFSSMKRTCSAPS